MALPVSIDELQPSAGGVAAPDTAAPVPEAAPAGPDQASADLLSKIAHLPVIQAVQSGQPGAAYAPPSIFGGLSQMQESAQRLATALPHIGLGAVIAPKAGVLVVYNLKEHTPEQIVQADAAGQLGHIAIPAVGSEHGAHLPTNAAGDMPVDPSAATPDAMGGGLGLPPAGAVVPPAAPLPAGSQDAITRARLNNLATQPPSQAALPSQGIINGLIKRAA